MKIGINASFIRKQDSGIGQVSANFLRMLASQIKNDKNIFKEIEFVLYLEKNQEIDFSDKFEKCVVNSFYRRDDLIGKIIWEKFLLPRRVEKDGCDVFFSLYQSTTVLKKIRHVMLVHDAVWKKFPQYLNNSRKRFYYYLVGEAISKADEIVTVSENSKKDIKRFFRENDEKIAVIPIDCDKIFKEKISQDKKAEVLASFGLEEDKYIFYVGGFDVRKNVDALIRAYGILYTRQSKKIEMPRLILAGSFHSNLVPLVTDIPNVAEEVMQKNGIPRGYIESIGFVSQADLPIVYAGAKLFCYPSLYEGFGLPVLEAMNVACPVVTSNISSIPEIVSEEDAILVDPKNDEKIAEGMLSLLVNDDFAKAKAENAKQKATEFSWEETTKKIMNLLKKI
jgi:glycosyltransferase involved in cell wall biosynthesis